VSQFRTRSQYRINATTETLQHCTVRQYHSY